MRATLVSLAVVAFAGCGNDRLRPPSLEEADAEARTMFPNLGTLYAGDNGLYRGCGPNGGVCHNGNEFPNLDSMGSIVDSVGRDCNQKKESADTLHDMCETRGDLVTIDIGATEEQIEIAWIIPVEGSGEPPRTWQMRLRSKPVSFMGYQRMEVKRGDETFVNIASTLDENPTIDPTDPSGRTILLQLSPPVPSGYDRGAEVAKRLAKTGVPGAADGLRAGDPNRNDIFGGELNSKLIVPGDPQRSYLMRRLIDPSAGPLMPRANCCFWSKPAVRALWCWIAGLDATASNAFAPIDYESCPSSPAVELGYPEPGEGCETAGMCPPVATGGTNEPTFPSIYSEILVPKCSGEGCHDRAPFGGEVDFSDEETAYAGLETKVEPGNPAASSLALRLDPALCVQPLCRVMPLDRPQLPEADVMRIHQWIMDGALRD